MNEPICAVCGRQRGDQPLMSRNGICDPWSHELPHTPECYRLGYERAVHAASVMLAALEAHLSVPCTENDKTHSAVRAARAAGIEPNP